MRTTINLEDQIYDLVREMAESKKLSMGKVISNLIKKSLSQDAKTIESKAKKVKSFEYPDGFPLLPPSGTSEIMTLEKVNAIREEIGA